MFLKGLVVEVAGAAEADAGSVALDEAVEVDAFAAEGAGYALAFEAGELAGWERDADPVGAEEVGVGEFAVGLHLLGVFFEGGVELFGAGLGGLEGDDAEAFVGVEVERGVEVDEGGGHLAEVAKLEGAFADAAAGDDADGVGGAAVDFDEGDEALAIGVEVSVGEGAGAGVVDAELAEGEHGHADAEDLAGAEMSVGYFGVVEEVVELRGHTSMVRRCCFSDGCRIQWCLWPIVSSPQQSGGRPG